LFFTMKNDAKNNLPTQPLRNSNYLFYLALDNTVSREIYIRSQIAVNLRQKHSKEPIHISSVPLYRWQHLPAHNFSVICS
jgi:hypothetical protein